jgi:hypothetical protein
MTARFLSAPQTKPLIIVPFSGSMPWYSRKVIGSPCSHLLNSFEKEQEMHPIRLNPTLSSRSIPQSITERRESREEKKDAFTQLWARQGRQPQLVPLRRPWSQRRLGQLQPRRRER